MKYLVCRKLYKDLRGVQPVAMTAQLYRLSEPAH